MHCADVAYVWSAARSDPCRAIVETQSSDPSVFQVPEPWAGHPHEAPILMISSNPSISQAEPYPAWSQHVDDRVTFSISASATDRTRLKTECDARSLTANDDGTWHSKQNVAYWRDCKANVEYVLQRPAEPGVDYVMTEVVHCKSRQETEMAAAAAKHCADRWLDRVLTLSPTAVVVVLGDTARRVSAAGSASIYKCGVSPAGTSAARTA
jgi:hypothetical protein